MKHSFTIVVTNSHATLTRTFILGKGLKVEQGQIVDGAFDAIEDTPSDENLTASGEPESIEKFVNFFVNNHIRTGRMKFASNKDGQVDTSIKYRNESPFRTLGDRNISLSQYTNENTVKTNVVTMPVPLDFNDQSKLEIPVVADSTLRLTIEIDDILNGAEISASTFGGANM